MKFSSLFLYHSVHGEKSNMLTWAIRLIFSDPVTNINIGSVIVVSDIMWISVSIDKSCMRDRDHVNNHLSATSIYYWPAIHLQLCDYWLPTYWWLWQNSALFKLFSSYYHINPPSFMYIVKFVHELSNKPLKILTKNSCIIHVLRTMKSGLQNICP